MNRCPITYESIEEEKYSKNGLKLISKKIKQLHDFPYTSKELIHLAGEMASKISIQGVQPKLSIALNIRNEIFEIVDSGGRYILKPPHALYDELPQNEDLTMKMASIVGIEVPLHGMIYNKDGSLSYFIKRFDRLSKGGKVSIEDFSQLLGFSRETKYESSMEKVASVVGKHCTFPVQEKIKLFRRVIFNFLVGNEDMHLKNFSLIRRNDKVELSPAYDFLNTTIATGSKEEIALPLKGKKSNLSAFDLMDYYGEERLGLSKNVISSELTKFNNALSLWNDLITKSFLSDRYKESYLKLIETRRKLIF